MDGEAHQSGDLKAGDRRTRLAPSPTGALHLGNARTFVLTWAAARKWGWGITLRIEDLDGPRVKPEAAAGIVSTLSWLGIDWDAGPLVQSEELRPCREAMNVLARRGLAYPSELTRAQIEAASSAPQEGVHEIRFGPELRPEWMKDEMREHGQKSARGTQDNAHGQTSARGTRGFDDEMSNWRFVVEGGSVVEFADAAARLSPVRVDVGATMGDFVIWTKRGTPAYQLAVVVDDARQGVTDVVRGRDLLDSAARQLLLYRALGLAPEPRYAHLALVVGPDERRLAKRHGDTRVERYRAAGVPAEAVLGWIAWSAGLIRERGLISARELCELFSGWGQEPDRLTFGPEDDAWLLSRAR